MNTTPPSMENGSVFGSHTAPGTTLRNTGSSTRTAFELVYCFGYGLVVGFLVAAGVGILLAYAVKVTEGLDGE